MTTMDQRISAHFGTKEAAAQEAEAEKVASENFAKVAAAANLDLERMSNEDVNGLYGAWNVYAKTAADNNINLAAYPLEKVAEGFVDWVQREIGANQPDPVVQHAEAYAAKLAAAVQTEERDFERGEFMGKVAAHSFVAQLREMEKGAEGEGEAAAEAAKASKGVGQAIREGAGKAWSAAKGAPGKALQLAKDHPKTTIGLGTGTALASIVAGKMLHDHVKDKRREKETTGAPDATPTEKAAFDQLSGGIAVRMLVERGVNEKVATDRIIEAINQNTPSGDAVKVAAAQGANMGVARALELIELADFEIS